MMAGLSEFDAKEKAKEMISNFLNWEKTFKGEIVSVEEWYPFKIDGFEIKCKTDRINKLPDGKFEIVDYKSSKRALSSNKLGEDLKMKIYALAIKNRFDQDPAKIIHYYPKPEKHENGIAIEAAITPPMLEETENKIKEIIKAIIEEKFEIVEEPNCMFCDYKGICEWRQGKGV